MPREDLMEQLLAVFDQDTAETLSPEEVIQRVQDKSDAISSSRIQSALLSLIREGELHLTEGSRLRRKLKVMTA